MVWTENFAPNHSKSFNSPCTGLASVPFSFLCISCSGDVNRRFLAGLSAVMLAMPLRTDTRTKKFREITSRASRTICGNRLKNFLYPILVFQSWLEVSISQRVIFFPLQRLLHKLDVV